MIAEEEEARLDALLALNLLDTPSSDSFDRITRMAGQLFNLPIAAVSLTDRDRQWFKSRIGVTHRSIPRTKAPCAQVAESTRHLVIADLLADPDYADSVLARSGVRFYAGAPLVTRDGFGLGSLCVLGVEPRAVSQAEMAALADLANIVMAQIELEHAFGRIDPVSGLPNRTQFLEDLEDLARDHPGERRFAVLVDLARPDQLDNAVRVVGPGFIDDVVKEAARTLKKDLRPGAVGYHVGSTQFAFLSAPDVEQSAYVALLTEKLAAARAISRTRFVLTSAIGIAPIVLGEATPADALRMAHSAAMDARKAEFLIGVYSASNNDIHKRRFALLNDFGQALVQPDQLRLVFQPRIDLETGRCVGAEALLRWRHPVLGEVSPAEFIPIVEHSALAKPMTAWVLSAALGQLHAWRRQGRDFHMSVNISTSNLEERDFVSRLRRLLRKHGVPPRALELEVTESAVMQDAARALEQLLAVKAVGVRIGIDDFGTGYSSMAYLQQLPADVVKIDRSFISGIVKDSREHALVGSMVTLLRNLGYWVVGEGVETLDAARLLFEIGCDEAQGFIFAQPLEPAAFDAWLLSRSSGFASTVGSR